MAGPPTSAAVVAAASNPAQNRRARVNMSAPFAAAVRRRCYFGATTNRGWTDTASSGMYIGIELTDMKTRHLLASIGAFVTALGIILGPAATNSEVASEDPPDRPQSGGVWIAAID